MYRKTISVAVLIVGLFLLNVSAWPQSISQDEDRFLAQKPLEDVNIKAQSIGQLFSDLSLAYNIPIGMEAALNDDESAIYYLSFKKGTLSDLLTAFVTKNSRYSWQIKNGVVRIFPREGQRDSILAKLLAVRVSSFAIPPDTSCSALEKSLLSTPEVRDLLVASAVSFRERNFTGFYFPQLGRQFTLRASNETVESILNRVIRESTTAKFWFVTRSKYDHAVLLTLNAHQEVVSQTSIRTKYGEPTLAYSVSEHIWMTPEYSADGQVCQARLYPRRVAADVNYLSGRLSFEELTDVLNQLVPVDKRGAKKQPFGITDTGAPAAWTTYGYERVTFTFVSPFSARGFAESAPSKKEDFSFPVLATRADTAPESLAAASDDFRSSKGANTEVVVVKWMDRKCANGK